MFKYENFSDKNGFNSKLTNNRFNTQWENTELQQHKTQYKYEWTGYEDLCYLRNTQNIYTTYHTSSPQTHTLLDSLTGLINIQSM